MISLIFALPKAIAVVKKGAALSLLGSLTQPVRTLVQKPFGDHLGEKKIAASIFDELGRRSFRRFAYNTKAGIIFQNGSVLLLKNKAAPIYPSEYWEPPAGEMIYGHSSSKILANSVEETTGLKFLELIEFSSSFETSRPTGQIWIQDHAIVHAEGEIMLDSTRYTDFSWIKEDELETFKKHNQISPEVYDAVRRAFLHEKMRKLRVASDMQDT